MLACNRVSIWYLYIFENIGIENFAGTGIQIEILTGDGIGIQIKSLPEPNPEFKNS